MYLILRDYLPNWRDLELVRQIEIKAVAAQKGNEFPGGRGSTSDLVGSSLMLSRDEL